MGEAEEQMEKKFKIGVLVLLAIFLVSGSIYAHDPAKEAMIKGIEFDKKGKYDEAIAEFDKAIELNPNFAEAYKNRGISFYHMEENKCAISDFSKAKELNPKILIPRIAEDEARAIVALKDIASAAHTYRSTHRGYPSSLKDLYEGLTPPSIDAVLAKGTYWGYSFELIGIDSDSQMNYQGFTVNASPKIPGTTGKRHFFLDTTGVIRFNLTQKAGVNDKDLQ